MPEEKNSRYKKKAKHFITHYVNDEHEVKTRIIKTNQDVTPVPKPTLDYHPTEIMGFCRTCKMTGTIEFAGRFSYNTGDKLQGRKPIVCYCPKCGGDSEFVPIDFKNANQQSLKWLGDVEQNNLKKEVN